MTRVNGVVGACDLVWVEGPDAGGFLQGLLTNDVASLEIGDSHHTLFLDDSGHIQADLRLRREDAQNFTLVTNGGHGRALVDRLEGYHFSEDLLVLGPESAHMVTVLGSRPVPTPAVDLLLPGVTPGTWDAIGADADAMASALEVALVDPSALDRLRVGTGTPIFGVDYGPEHLVQEAGLDTRTVSFDKGCYLGQETVARLHYRGRANRRLVALQGGGSIEPGAAVTFAGRPVGTVTTVSVADAGGWIGLAIVRREAQDGSRVNVGLSGEPATVVPVPFTEGSQNSP